MVTFGLAEIAISGVPVETEGAVALSVSRSAVSIKRTGIDGVEKILKSIPDRVKCTLQIASAKNLNGLFDDVFSVSGKTATDQNLTLSDCVATDFAVDYKTIAKRAEVSIYKISFTAGGFGDGSES